MTHTLPVSHVVDPLRKVLRDQFGAVLIAPPGSGKSTYLPLQLREETWLSGRRIIMLEPRRLAARNVAFWMAQQLGERVGKTIGYRMRGESIVGTQTRIEVVTEGILTRMLLSDPELGQYGLVIFDEFHERNLNSDLAFALCLDLQKNLRDDLRILVMSATLDAEPVAALMDNAPVIESEGRMHPVTVQYHNTNIELRNASAIANTIYRVMQQETGDILVFLPGAGEIQRVQDELSKLKLDGRTQIYPIYGSLTQQEQERAIAPCSGSQRKIVLATNVAETSLTIEGIKIVIDSGFQRVSRFHVNSAMTRLETTRIARANAEQRCGRAGRLGPGVCYRLWTEDTQRALLPANDPEILQTDLAPLVLSLAQWGVRTPAALAWLTPPPNASFEKAQTLLVQLGALDENNAITAHGRRMLELGTHPRLAHMIIMSIEMGLGTSACDLAAMLGERDIFINADTSDMQTRLEAMHGALHTQGISLHKGTLQRVRNESARWQKQLGIKPSSHDPQRAGMLLALAYPDRIAKLRGENSMHYVLSNGKGARLQEGDSLRNQPYLVVANLDGQQQNARIFLAATITDPQIQTLYGSRIKRVENIFWNKKERCVNATIQTRLFKLTLNESKADKPDASQITSVLLSGVQEEGIEQLPWEESARQLQARIDLARKLEQDADWPDVSNMHLTYTLEHWLGPYVNNISCIKQISADNVRMALAGLLDWNQLQYLDSFLPMHFVAPTGSKIKIDYCEGDLPVVRVRLQELFGLAETPTIAHGKVQLLLHLLSPAQRPIQVTRDLGSFWQNTYRDVKKDLKGRYPKHYWPDDPLAAEPTRRAKPTGKSTK